jgi:CubicO group peptidase (beta-lactamase class C family)
VLDVTAAQLLARTARAQVDGRLPSLAVGVVQDRALAWTGGRGAVDGAEPTPATQYRIGSITKTFVAIQVMQLRDSGRLSLGTTVDTLVPGTPVGDRTVGQLLGHLSGLRAETTGDWWERTPGRQWSDLVEPLGPEAVPFPAGRRFHYSNVGFAVLGELVSRTHGVPWAAALRRDVLDPLGMQRTSPAAEPPAAPGLAVHPWAPVLLTEPSHDYAAMAPAGQLWSTVADLSVLARFLLGDTGDVLSSDTVEEMSEPGAVDNVERGSSYGLGLQILSDEARTYVGHGGSVPGFLAGLFVDHEERSGAVTLANSTSGLNGRLTIELMTVLRDLEPRVIEAWSPGSLPADIELGLLGPWFWGPTPYALHAGADGLLHLHSLTGGEEGVHFGALGGGRWVGMNDYFAGEVLTVVRDASGRATQLDIGSFSFSRTVYDPAANPPGGVDESGWR